MKQKATLSLGGLVLAVLAAIFFPKGTDQPTAPGTPSMPTAAQPAPPTPPTANVETPAPSQPAAAAAKSTPTPAPTPAMATSQPSPAPAKSTPSSSNPPKTGPPASQTVKTEPKTGLPASTSKVGWSSRAGLESHFEKHGAEFDKITIDDYLAMAKALRDAPLSKEVLEIVRDSDGVTSRFHTRSGAFAAFNKDQTIRTMFKPNDGIAYFQRQGNR